MKPDGTKTKSDKEKAELFNDFFSSVFTNEDTNNVPTIEMKDQQDSYTEIEVNELTVRKKLSKLKTNKSPGMDGMHPRVLRELQDEIAKPISLLINQTLETGSLPQDWRDALVTPIYKKEKKTEPCNYRPVSLTSLVCKIAESIIRDHMMNHISENYLLTDHQHSFVPKESCATQLLECLDIWTDILDNGGVFDIIYMDYAKAFDKVAHERLLTKVESFGINGKVLNWIRGFLANRRQKVAVHGSVSNWAPVRSGVPQGSVLGPLFVIFIINDPPVFSEYLIRMFA